MSAADKAVGLAELFYGRVANLMRSRRAARHAPERRPPERRLVFESFEARILLSGDPLALLGTIADDTLGVTATDFDSGSYSLNGGEAVAFDDIASFSFDGLGGNDVLIINNPGGGLFAPIDGITYAGGG